MKAGLWGLVLAGGLGSRLGGDKPFKKLAGHRLIDLALMVLSKVCSRLMIVTNNVVAYTEYSHLILADRWPGQGPLAALATAFLDSPARGALIMAVDMPLVRVDLLAALAKGYGRDKALAPLGPYWPEPLLAYYSRDCLSLIIQLLSQGERRPRMLLRAINARLLSREEVLALDPKNLSFININFPEDLIIAEQEGCLRGVFSAS